MAVEYDKLIGAVCAVGTFILGILAYLGITCCKRWRMNVQIEYIPPTDESRSLQVRLVSNGSPARLRAVKVKGAAWPAANSAGNLWPVEDMSSWAARWASRGIVCHWYSPVLGSDIQASDILLNCARGNTERDDWLRFKDETQGILADVLGKFEIWYDPKPGGGVWSCLTCGDRKCPKRCVLYSYHDFTRYA